MRNEHTASYQNNNSISAARSERAFVDSAKNGKSSHASPSSPKMQNMGKRFEKLIAQQKARQIPDRSGGNSIGELTAGSRESDGKIASLKQAYQCTSAFAKIGRQASEMNADKADAGAMGRKDGMAISAMKGCKKGVGQIGDSIDFITDLIKSGGKGQGGSGGSQSKTPGAGGVGTGAGGQTVAAGGN